MLGQIRVRVVRQRGVGGELRPWHPASKTFEEAPILGGQYRIQIGFEIGSEVACRNEHGAGRGVVNQFKIFAHTLLNIQRAHADGQQVFHRAEFRAEAGAFPHGVAEAQVMCLRIGRLQRAHCLVQPGVGKRVVRLTAHPALAKHRRNDVQHLQPFGLDCCHQVEQPRCFHADAIQEIWQRLLAKKL